jgi:hypothetical protein
VLDIRIPNQKSLLDRIEILAMKSSTVVIGFAEAMAAPEVLWSLVDQGYRVTAFARKGRQHALQHSRHVLCRQLTPPEVDLQAAVSDLRALLISLDRIHDGSERILFPLDDAAVWMCNKVQLDPSWILAGPRGRNAELALDKYVQVRSAEKAGFHVPETRIATTPDEVWNKGDSFPLILKPAKSVITHQNRLYKSRSWICGNQEELERAVEAWTSREPLLVQPFISGTGEGIFGLATSEGVRAWSAHRRLRMMNPHGSGSSACVSQAVPEDMKASAERFVKDAGWSGLFMIELLRDRSGTYWFMELNGRPWGSMALARRQGMEYPAWTVRQASDAQFSRTINQSGVSGLVCRHLGRELMYPLFVLRGPDSKALTNWPSFWKAIVDVMRFHRREYLYNWRKDDPRVFLSDCFYTFRNQVIKSRP